MVPGEQGPLLICFDDSEPSRHAIGEAARLFPGARAVVLHVWASIESTAAYRYSAAGASGVLKEAMDELDEAGQRAAQQIADQGARLAREAGLDVEALAVEVKDNPSSSVAEEAERLDASVVVMGSRGMGPLQSLALGGFSTSALHRLHRPVLVVPAE
jgi:nucleotide-binding universal stress UspA family protein